MKARTANFVAVDRLARFLWAQEYPASRSDRDDMWSRFIERYRARAREILLTPDGWKR